MPPTENASAMIPIRLPLSGLCLVLAAVGASAADAPAAKPALTVTAVRPQPAELPLRVAANGNIAAWQESVIGTEANGLRLSEVRVNVGDIVKKGQMLAVFAPDLVAADAAQAEADVAQAEAALAEAGANARRARELEAKGFISPQKVTEALTAEKSAAARLEAQRAISRNRGVRLAQTRVVAPDDGVISSRTATVGAVLPAGQELFRLIRQGRLEWRAEVAAPDLARLKPGMPASVVPPGGEAIPGKVRMLAPTVDPQTRNGIVYVDLPSPGAARAGMFARGEFDIGTARGLTLPQGAVLQKEGFAYVLRLGPPSGDLARVALTKVTTGRRAGERIEITGGLDASTQVVASGGAFLADGDTVRLVPQAAAPATAPAAR